MTIPTIKSFLTNFIKYLISILFYYLGNHKHLFNKL